jgi:predicted ATPase
LPGPFFVRREREFGELRSALEDALAGRGGLVLLAGDPGIGKTRLADELSNRARSQGALVLWGRCWEGAGAPAYWPWIQVIRACARELDDAVLAASLGPGASHVAQAIPELRERLPALPALPQSLDSDSARFS